jgi:hypothetical protein
MPGKQVRVSKVMMQCYDQAWYSCIDASMSFGLSAGIRKSGHSTRLS